MPTARAEGVFVVGDAQAHAEQAGCTPCGERPAPQRAAAAPLPSPDATVKQLLSTIEALQQQQAHAEAARLAADEAARSAGLETQELERQLHEMLRRTAASDDQVDQAQLVLDARLQEKASKAATLKVQRQALDSLRSAVEGLEQLCAEKDTIILQLKERLLAAGVSEASLAQLEAQACSGPGAPSPAGAPTEAGRPSWFGSGGALFRRWEGRRKSQA